MITFPDKSFFDRLKAEEINQIKSVVNDLFSQVDGVGDLPDTLVQVVDATAQALAVVGVDLDFISYQKEVKPADASDVGTKGAYFTDGSFQMLEWDGAEWQGLGVPIDTIEGARVQLASDIMDRAHIYRPGQHVANSAGGLMIRYDDGFKDHYDIAFQIHKKYGLPALVVPITDFIDEEFVEEYGGKPGMSWANLIEMQASGVMEVGLHGKNHGRLSEMTTEQAFEHINGGYAKMFTEMGHDPRWYVPPYNDGQLEAGSSFAYRLFERMVKQAKFYHKINERTFHVPSRYMELPYGVGSDIASNVNLIKERVRRGEFIHGMVHHIEDADKYEEMIQALIAAKIPILDPVALSYPTHNLIYNPSFQQDIANHYTIQPGDGNVGLDSTKFFAGTRSLRLLHTGSGDQIRPRIVGNELIRLEKGVEYTFTMWVNSSVDQNINARFQYRAYTEFLEAVEIIIPTIINEPITKSGEWVMLQGTVTPDYTTYARPLIGLFYTGSSEAILHVDSVSIVESNRYDFNGYE